MPTIILGKPLTFGDKEQIDFIRKQAYSAFLKQFWHESSVTCEHCGGSGEVTGKIYECPSCHVYDEYNNVVFEWINEITCTCKHCKKEFKFEE